VGRTVTRPARDHTGICSESGAANGHVCWNVVFGLISSTFLNHSGTQRDNRESDLRAGTAFEVRLTSTLARWSVNKGSTFMPPDFGKEVEISARIWAY